MKVTNRKIILLCGGLVILILAAMLAYQNIAVEDGAQYTSLTGNTDAHWTWQNPETLQEAAIPSTWRKVENTVYAGALLTLTHDSGQSLVYLVNEHVSRGMSLGEYATELEGPLGERLGFDEFEDRAGEREYVEARGAEYFGDTVAHTRVRVWAPDPGDFWQAVAITDQDYTELEYEAVGIMDLLLETTR